MHDLATDILDPEQPVKLSNGQEITVREMTWKKSKRFFSDLAVRVGEFVTIPTDGTRPKIDNDKLLQIVTGDLSEALILASTDLDAATLEAMPLRDVFALLNPAIALNLRAEMIEQGAKTFGRLKSLMGK